MNNPQKFKFIEGSFSAMESREILKNVFTSKIQFHQIKNFSSQERFGVDDTNSIARIAELKESMSEVIMLIADAHQQGKQLEIRSEIQITIL